MKTNLTLSAIDGRIGAIDAEIRDWRRQLTPDYAGEMRRDHANKRIKQAEAELAELWALRRKARAGQAALYEDLPEPIYMEPIKPSEPIKPPAPRIPLRITPPASPVVAALATPNAKPPTIYAPRRDVLGILRGGGRR